MSAVQVSMYELRCDEPGCRATLEEDGMQMLHPTQADARDMAHGERDWDVADAEQDRDYCYEHAKPVCDYCGARATGFDEDNYQPLCGKHESEVRS